MNKIITNTLRTLSVCALATVTVAGLTSCDNIAEDDRYIPIEVHHSEKVVLLEDFTGVQCVNCPEAAEVINNLHETYHENFIAVGLHPKGSHFTEPIIPRYDLRSDAATAVFQRYNPSVFPTAMIDRTSFDGSVLQENRNTWGAKVVEQLKQQTKVDLSFTVSHQEGSTELEIQYEMGVTDAIDDDLYLQLWVIENGIVAPQLTETGRNMQYVHNHVLRAAINGDWGEELAKPNGHTSWMRGDGATGTYRYTPDSKWKFENLQVVGFVYRKSDGVILQAHLCSVNN